MGLIGVKLTYEHLRQMPDDGRRYELVEGELVVSPAPKTRHQRVVHHIHRFLDRAEQAGVGRVYTAPTDVVLDPEGNALQPDLLFIVSERLGRIVTDDSIRGAPDLVVEVLSDSSADRDLGVKLRLYARFGVRFYWVADPSTQTLRAFELRPGGYLEQPPLQGEAVLGCPLLPGITTPAAALFAD